MTRSLLSPLPPIVIVVLAGFAPSVPGGADAGDSTYPRTAFDAPKTSDSSILGRANDGMTCQYAGSTGKIDCVYSIEGKEYVAVSATAPTYSRFGGFPFGRLSVERNGHYGFANGEGSSPARGGTGLEYCRLALQFRTANGEIIWIWHNELHYANGRQLALIDTNGDSHADLAVNGGWGGVVHGSRRWWTPDPSNSAYASDERSYTTRPAFSGKTSRGRSRGCKPLDARLLKLVPLGTRLSGTVAGKVPVWRSTSAP